MPPEKDHAVVIESLRTLAEWFDNPALSPMLWVEVKGQSVTPGYLLRAIANALKKNGMPK